MGLGLKRGWQALMDTCYAVDNLYNKELFCARKGKDPSSWTWDDHYEALTEQVAANFEFCNRLKVSEELGKGAYSETGPVLTQLKKLNKDAEIPTLEVEIDPWQRYQALEKENGDVWKTKMKDEKWVHPVVQKVLNKQEFYDKTGKSKSGEFKYVGKKLISINGKVPGGAGGGGGGGSKPAAAAAPAAAEPAAAPEKKFDPVRRQPSIIKGPPLAELAKQSKVQIEEKAQAAQKSLQETVIAGGIEEHMKKLHRQNSTNEKRAPGRRSTVDDLKTVQAAMQNVPENLVDEVARSGVGEAEAADNAWARLTGGNLSPAQKAELAHNRNMIECITKSLATFREAEKKLLAGSQ